MGGRPSAPETGLDSAPPGGYGPANPSPGGPQPAQSSAGPRRCRRNGSSLSWRRWGQPLHLRGVEWAGNTGNANTGGFQVTFTGTFQIVSRGGGTVDSVNAVFHVAPTRTYAPSTLGPARLPDPDQRQPRIPQVGRLRWRPTWLSQDASSSKPTGNDQARLGSRAGQHPNAPPHSALGPATIPPREEPVHARPLGHQPRKRLRHA